MCYSGLDFSELKKEMKLQEILNDLAHTKTQLIAVSKTKSEQAILALYEQGHLDFGENKVQELSSKYEALPKDIRWHHIGHLQTNKIKYITPFVHLIHSVDSFKVLKEINKRAKQNERSIDCLLQFKIAEEESKFGLNITEALEILSSSAYTNMQHIRIVGVMGMATYTDNEQQVRDEFKKLKSMFDQLKERFFADDAHFKEISMGMSGDYQIAIEEGSTMIRIGSLLFGERD